MAPADTDQAPLFAENGASWSWVLAGPVAAVAMIIIQITSGIGIQWVVPAAFLVLVSAFVALQIKAARIHTSVELTAHSLRQGTETVLIDEILAVYPAPKNTTRSYYDDRRLNRDAGKSNALTNRALKKAGLDLSDLERAEPVEETEEQRQAQRDAALVEKWQSARALGELTGVPRGRTGIGLKLSGGRTAQAWARRPADLRAALTKLVDDRQAGEQR